MIAIQFFATPTAKVKLLNGIVTTTYTTYHIANLYRGRERYKVWCSAGLEGAQWGVTGGDKTTGFEPFCQKWAERFKSFAALVSWGYSWNGNRFNKGVETEMCKYCDRLQVVTCYPKQDELETLLNLHRSHGRCWYSSDYVRLKKSAREGWVKTINIK